MGDESTGAATEMRMAAAMQEFMARAVLFQEAVARSAGLNGSDLQCLSLLISDGPATPGELARRAGLTAGGTITAVIDRLERAGYVTRSRDQHDRRKVVVTPDLTAVTSAVGQVYERITARWLEYLATLDPEQVELAIDLFSRAAAINREETERLLG